MLNENADPLSSVFSALADPTRRAILTRLRHGEATVSELAEPFDMSLPAISRHLKVLEKAGLVSREVEAQWRRCRIQARPMKDAMDWIEEYRRFWDERFDALDQFLEENKPENGS